MRHDIDQTITDKIVADLERGVRPWHRPWDAGHLAGRILRPLRHNGIPYQDINTVALWMQASAQGYTSPFWLTFRQALAMGACVRKGEKGSPVVHAGALTRSDSDGEEPTGETEASDARRPTWPQWIAACSRPNWGSIRRTLSSDPPAS